MEWQLLRPAERSGIPVFRGTDRPRLEGWFCEIAAANVREWLGLVCRVQPGHCLCGLRLMWRVHPQNPQYTARTSPSAGSRERLSGVGSEQDELECRGSYGGFGDRKQQRAGNRPLLRSDTAETDRRNLWLGGSGSQAGFRWRCVSAGEWLLVLVNSGRIGRS
ncbi:MAG TPA: hypothetical protein DCX79_15160 [Planctomycetaceae bacterium]|nr:hypothetical protein [Planctomycetaceae bacterium]